MKKYLLQVDEHKCQYYYDRSFFNGLQENVIIKILDLNLTKMVRIPTGAKIKSRIPFIVRRALKYRLDKWEENEQGQ